MEWMVGLVALVIGGAAGAVVAFLIADRRGRARLAESQTAAALAEQRSADLAAQFQREAVTAESLRGRLSAAETGAATLAQQYQSAQQNMLEQKQLLEDAQKKLREAFATVSADALKQNTEAFLHLAKEKFQTLSTEAAGSLDQRKAQIEGLLKPLQEMLSQYQLRLGDVEKSRVESYSMLREQLGVLAETQRTLNTNTNQLVSALRRPQTRGQWGEITLRRLVELAGLSSHCDFSEQTSVDTEAGRLRPDMVVNLPTNRTIVIDCKAALDAFLDAASAPDEDNRKVCLQRHCQQVRARARELSQKSYWSQFPRSPEYVVMFLPGEAFLYAAVELDGDLIEDCLKNRVIVATPTTLIALLKAIEFGWRQEESTQNAEAIRKLGSDLYDRVAILATHFSKLGATLENAVGHYNNVVGSLETRVLVSARKMAELGARTDREVPPPEVIDTRTREISGVGQE